MTPNTYQTWNSFESIAGSNLARWPNNLCTFKYYYNSPGILYRLQFPLEAFLSGLAFTTGAMAINPVIATAATACQVACAGLSVFCYSAPAVTKPAGIIACKMGFLYCEAGCVAGFAVPVFGEHYIMHDMEDGRNKADPEWTNIIGTVQQPQINRVGFSGRTSSR